MSDRPLDIDASPAAREVATSILIGVATPTTNFVIQPGRYESGLLTPVDIYFLKLNKEKAKKWLNNKPCKYSRVIWNILLVIEQ